MSGSCLNADARPAPNALWRPGLTNKIAYMGWRRAPAHVGVSGGDAQLPKTLILDRCRVKWPYKEFYP